MQLVAIASIVLLVWCAHPTSADTPANCSYVDIQGKWMLMESSRGFDSTIDGCDKSQEYVRNRTVLLRFPDTVEDNFGNRGYWTLIYNQGFEIHITGRRYFMFSAYYGNNSDCHNTNAGWSHTIGGLDWSCAKSAKMSSLDSLSSTSQLPSVQYKNNAARFYHNVAADKSQLYKANHEYIDALNRVQTSWKATHYKHYEGLTLRDMFYMSGGPKSKIAGIPHAMRSKILSEEKQRKLNALPKEFDWRKMGGLGGRSFVSPVRNQGQCGSCYAFSSMGMNEARLRVQTNNTITTIFSTQDIVECCRYSQGCEGGFPYLVGGKYVADFGIVAEECNPYKGKDGTCSTKADCARSYGYKYGYVGGFYGACNEDEMKIALMDGPLAASFEVYPDFLQYKGGVYHHVEGLEDKFNPFEITNHAVLLVGYGVDADAGPYWVVKNSWGTTWGEDGYFRIRRGTDECSIESIAVESFPVL